MASRRAQPQEIKQVRTALSLAFPNCFAAKGGKKKPLKIGIRADVMAEARAAFPALSRRLIDACLRDYCGGQNYLKCTVKGATRVDLHGNFAGFVTADEAKHALEMLARAAKAKASRKTVKRPDIGAQAVGVIADAVLSRAERLMKLRADLARLETAQYAASMSDNWYFSSGRKDRDDAQIRAVADEIKTLEAAE